MNKQLEDHKAKRCKGNARLSKTKEKSSRFDKLRAHERTPPALFILYKNKSPESGS